MKYVDMFFQKKTWICIYFNTYSELGDLNGLRERTKYTSLLVHCKNEGNTGG